MRASQSLHFTVAALRCAALGQKRKLCRRNFLLHAASARSLRALRSRFTQPLRVPSCVHLRDVLFPYQVGMESQSVKGRFGQSEREGLVKLSLDA